MFGKSKRKLNRQFLEVIEEPVWDTSRICELLDKGADVNTSDEDGKTALMMAAERDNLRNIHLFLSKGADIDREDDDGWTALHYAAARGHHRSLYELLNAGANPDAGESTFGQSPVSV